MAYKINSKTETAWNDLIHRTFDRPTLIEKREEYYINI